MAEKGERQEEEGASSLAIEHEDEGVEAMVEGRLGYHEHASVDELHGDVRNVEYLLLAAMSELSTMRCDRVFGLWLQVHGSRVSTESCRGGAVADGPCEIGRASCRERV